jgi:hypothetical protein
LSLGGADLVTANARADYETVAHTYARAADLERGFNELLSVGGRVAAFGQSLPVLPLSDPEIVRTGFSAS